MKAYFLGIISFVLINSSCTNHGEKYFAIQDTFSSSINPSSNFGLHKGLLCLYWTVNKEISSSKIYLNFNLDTLDFTENTKVILHLKFSSFNNLHIRQSGDNSTKISLVTEPWNELFLNWNNSPKIDSSLSVSVPATINSYQGYEVDISSLMLHAKQQNIPFHGICIEYQELILFKELMFASKEHTDPTKHPYLEIQH